MMQKFLLSLALFLPNLVLMAQDDEVADIDEWQVLKVEASKDPFANGNQFTINFVNYTAEEWHYPLPGAHLISPFGGERHHAGTDVKARPNDTIRAAFPGEVILCGPYFGYGNCVVLRHANGLETLYSHHSKILVTLGRWVHAGEPLALAGRTGRATTEHLHFETRVRGKAFNSELLFDHNANQLIPQVVVFTKLPNGQLKITTRKPDEPETKTTN